MCELDVDMDDIMETRSFVHHSFEENRQPAGSSIGFHFLPACLLVRRIILLQYNNADDEVRIIIIIIIMNEDLI